MKIKQFSILLTLLFSATAALSLFGKNRGHQAMPAHRMPPAAGHPEHFNRSGIK